MSNLGMLKTQGQCELLLGYVLDDLEAPGSQVVHPVPSFPMRDQSSRWKEELGSLKIVVRCSQLWILFLATANSGESENLYIT